jgi:hypothetical protein
MTAARGGTAVTHEERRLEASRQRTVQPHAVVLLGGDAASARGPWGVCQRLPRPRPLGGPTAWRRKAAHGVRPCDGLSQG